jgi:hypothetical protein
MLAVLSLRRNYFAQIRMWVNEKDPSKSDAVLFFSNASPAIPAGPQGCAVANPANGGSPLQLDAALCGNGVDGQDATTPVVTQVAAIWNITGQY